MDRIPHWLTVGSSLMSPWVIILALPPFYTGIWVQIEGPVAALHLLAALSLIGLAALIVLDRPFAREAVGHPYVLLLAGVAGLSVLFSPLAPLTAVSLLGRPEHGIGAIAFLDAAILTAAAIYGFQQASIRRLMLLSTALVVGTALILDGTFRSMGTWAPFFFGDYLGFYGIYAAVIIAAIYQQRPNLGWIAGLTVCLAIVILAGNRAALLSLLVGLPILAAILLFNARQSRLVPVLCGLFPIVVTVGILAAGPLFRQEIYGELRQTFDIPAVTDAISAAWASMWSRAMLGKMLVTEIQEHPLLLLWGSGWGHFPEALLTNLTLVPGRLHEFIGESRTYWDTIERFDFHSHNRFLESLYAGGIPVLITLLAFHASLPLFARPGARSAAIFFSLAMAVLLAFWFEMPQTLPVMAVALAAIADPAWSLISEQPRRRTIVAGACLVTGIALVSVTGVSFWMTQQAGKRLLADRSFDPAPIHKGISACNSLNFDNGMREIYLANLLQRSFAELSNKSAPAKRAQDIFLDRLCDATRDGAKIRSLTLLVSVNNVLSGIVFRHPDLVQKAEKQLALWGRLNREISRRAPNRGDLLIPYLNHLLSRGNEAAVSEISEQLLKVRPGSAVGLWFSGLVLMKTPSSQENAMRRLRHALDRGIGNMMPVDDNVIKAIRQ